jgi:hypothetical protein
MAIGAYLIVNIIAISEYVPNCSYFPNCFNEQVKPINYVMFWFGVLMLIMIIFFLIIMPCYVLNVRCLSKTTKKYKTNDATNSTHRSHTSISSIENHNSYYNMSNENNNLKHSSLYKQNNLNPDGTINYLYNNTNNHILITYKDQV